MKVSAMIAMKAIDMSSRYGAQAAKFSAMAIGKLALKLWMPDRAMCQKIPSSDQENK